MSVDDKQEIERLRKKCKELGQEILCKNEFLHQKNLELDALGYVWCDGGCEGGTFRYHDDMELTENQVEIVERNTIRLRQWFENRRCRRAQEEKKPMEKCEGCGALTLCFKERSDG